MDCIEDTHDIVGMSGLDRVVRPIDSVLTAYNKENIFTFGKKCLRGNCRRAEAREGD